MKIVRSDAKEFLKESGRIENRSKGSSDRVEELVRGIIRQVKRGGDRSIIRLTKRFDKIDLSKKGLAVSDIEVEKGLSIVPKTSMKHLRFAAQRIKRFHRHQMERSWSIVEEDDARLGQIIRPIERAGIYAPGGKASYPSSVLMNAIPAKVAGVKDVILCAPAFKGEVSPYVLAAAHIAGVDKIFAIGGAQAIAAMAFGTETVPRVDKITGPGNAYVTEAKRQVFGNVGIDMVAGPSEILIIADKNGRADFIAADLISQAEHDEQAYPILITDSEELAVKVKDELRVQTKRVSRGDIIRRSLRKNCALFLVKDMDEGIELANRFAPEHLEIMTERPNRVMKKITNAGAIFLGEYTPEAVGDYVAGPNHVLPTGGAAKFFSPLGVYDFLKRTSLISFTKDGLEKIRNPVIGIAEDEGLTGHAEAVRIRLR